VNFYPYKYIVIPLTLLKIWGRVRISGNGAQAGLDVEFISNRWIERDQYLENLPA